MSPFHPKRLLPLLHFMRENIICILSSFIWNICWWDSFPFVSEIVFPGCKRYYHRVKYKILTNNLYIQTCSCTCMNIDHLKFSFLSHIIMRILKLFPLHYPHLTNLVVELVVAVDIIAMSLIWKISHVTIILTVCLSLNLERWEESYKIFTFHNMMTTYRDL